MDFKTMTEMALEATKDVKTMMVYCDHIASIARRALMHNYDGLLKEVGPVRYDVNESGSISSSKKIIEVTDLNGRKYRVTVEEV